VSSTHWLLSSNQTSNHSSSEASTRKQHEIETIYINVREEHHTPRKPMLATRVKLRLHWSTKYSIQDVTKLGNGGTSDGCRAFHGSALMESLLPAAIVFSNASSCYYLWLKDSKPGAVG